MLENLEFCMKIKEDLQNIAKAKEMAIREMNGLPPVPPPWQEELRSYIVDGFHDFCCSAFCPCCKRKKPKPKKGITLTFCEKLKTEGTYENEVLKNFIGFGGGLVVSILLYYLCVLQLKLDVVVGAVIGAIVGFISCIGLAFFERFRCMTLLIIPNFFSSKGRMFLMMYATVLLINYPVLNFNHNVIVLTDSATCAQSLVMNETRELAELARAPVAGMIKDIKKMLQAIRQFAEKIKAAFRALCDALNEIKAAIVRSFGWIQSIAEECNKIMGVPYVRCTKAFDDAVSRCFDHLPPVVESICHVVTFVKQVCQVARAGQIFCVIGSLIHSFLTGLFDFDFGNIFFEWRDMFYFNVTLEYHYNFTTHQSKTFGQVRDDIVGEVKAKLDKMNRFLAFTDNIMMYMVLMVVVRSVLYRTRYLSKDNFDNRYITSNMVKINDARDAFAKEKALPLKRAEKRLYVSSFSLWLTRQEAKKMFKGIVMLVFSVVHGTFFMMCDYGLYWLLHLIQVHMEIKTHSDLPPHFALHVQGEGALADMYRTLIAVLDPTGSSGIEVDTTKCLPNPSVPDTEVYKTIYSLYLTCFILTIFEAYGLRLRHMICACYYPDRERKRAIWLYNHILVMRGSFLKFARRQLRYQNCTNKAVTRLSIRSRIIAQCPLFGKLLKLLGLHNKKVCLLCAREGVTSDYDNFEHCSTPSCDAVYCVDCFQDLKNLCTVCLNPVDYGDMSDVSEEIDSSEDEEALARRLKHVEERKERIRKMREKRRPSAVMAAFQRILHDEEGVGERTEEKSDRSGETTPDSEQEDLVADDVSVDTESSDGSYREEYDMSYQFKVSDVSDMSEEEAGPVEEEEEEDEKPRTKIDRVDMHYFDYIDSLEEEEDVKVAAPPKARSTIKWTPGQPLDPSVLEKLPPDMLEALGPEVRQMLVASTNQPQPQPQPP
ncbi:DC-STAMP domain-containing protein 2-like [Gigantopelta aegis]|uniref:DC-STAMP domain-containing protein 2-like n=1 Tax=Gigantopelta aegis TaxID=1735272 RepID=UPI001B889053|nr:DC-STAMP domain-containing protein 2-like [Gigantopelta aegis]